MLVISGCRSMLDEDDLRQILVGILAGQDVVPLLNIYNVGLNLGIVPVGPVRKKDAVVLVVIAPADAGILQLAEERRPLPQPIILPGRKNVAIRSSREQIGAVDDRRVRNRRVPG